MTDVHNFAQPDAHEFYDLEVDDLDYSLNQTFSKRPENMGTIHNQALWVACLACYLKQPTDTVIANLKIALEAALALFALTRSENVVTQVKVGGSSAEHRSIGPNDRAHSHTWLISICLAMLLRDKEAINELVEIDTDLLRASPTGVDEYRNLLVDLMKDFVQHQDTNKIEEVRKQAQVDLAASTYDKMLMAFVGAIESAGSSNGDEFSARIEEMLTHHRAYWGSKKNSSDPQGLLSLLGLGIASFSTDQGLICEINSDYMPGWLVNGEFKRD